MSVAFVAAGPVPAVSPNRMRPRQAERNRGHRARGYGLLLALLLFASAPAVAKPLYITVNRTFSTSESPIVDVAFENRGPVELRVLAPNDLDAYIAGQANLRRVWD